MKIVKFKDGQYAVRRLTIIGYQFLDIEKFDYWWHSPDCINNHCKTSDLKQAERAYNCYKDHGEPIKRNFQRWVNAFISWLRK